MIVYQVPAVMRHLTPLQIFEEGVTTFLAVGLFVYLASFDRPAKLDPSGDFTEKETYSDILEALKELEFHGLTERSEVIEDTIVTEMFGGGAV